jgi:geranylgeranyl diphosphate synthase type II
MDIKAYLSDRKRQVESFLEGYFGNPVLPRALHDSVVYSLTAGGKRIRPVLCIAAHEACGGDGASAIPFAASLEMLHTYSLIHDDLPAMDNDDLRRGKPTNHRVFGEGMAILAGDGLLTEVFSLLSDPTYRTGPITEGTALRAIREIALAGGLHGMVAGQAQDLLSENSDPDPETLSFIHLKKTAALIRCSIRTGGILASCSDEELSKLSEYGEQVGLAFQIVDDILDVEGETEVLGKPKGSDEKKKKMTYPRLYGLAESKRRARALLQSALEALQALGERADPLRGIARLLVERDR